MLINGTWDKEMQNAWVDFLSDQSPVVFLIRQEMRRGKRASEAMDFICGEGSYAKFAKEIWESCRAK